MIDRVDNQSIILDGHDIEALSKEARGELLRRIEQREEREGYRPLVFEPRAGNADDIDIFTSYCQLREGSRNTLDALADHLGVDAVMEGLYKDNPERKAVIRDEVTVALCLAIVDGHFKRRGDRPRHT